MATRTNIAKISPNKIYTFATSIKDFCKVNLLTTITITKIVTIFDYNFSKLA
jgi:hypothetical protein